MENTRKDSIKTREVAILVGDGYNHNELVEMQDLLKKKGAKPEVISKMFGMRNRKINQLALNT